jgi:hypothetical protein
MFQAIHHPKGELSRIHLHKYGFHLSLARGSPTVAPYGKTRRMPLHNLLGLSRYSLANQSLETPCCRDGVL